MNLLSQFTNSIKEFVKEDMEQKKKFEEAKSASKFAQDLSQSRYEVLSNLSMTQKIMQILQKASPYLGNLEKSETKDNAKDASEGPNSGSKVMNPYSKPAVEIKKAVP